MRRRLRTMTSEAMTPVGEHRAPLRATGACPGVSGDPDPHRSHHYCGGAQSPCNALSAWDQELLRRATRGNETRWAMSQLSPFSAQELAKDWSNLGPSLNPLLRFNWNAHRLEIEEYFTPPAGFIE